MHGYLYTCTWITRRYRSPRRNCSLIVYLDQRAANMVLLKPVHRFIKIRCARLRPTCEPCIQAVRNTQDGSELIGWEAMKMKAMKLVGLFQSASCACFIFTLLSLVLFQPIICRGLRSHNRVMWLTSLQMTSKVVALSLHVSRIRVSQHYRALSCLIHAWHKDKMHKG